MRIPATAPALLVLLSSLACAQLGGGDDVPSAPDDASGPDASGPDGATPDAAAPAPSKAGGPKAGAGAALPDLLADIDKGGCEQPGNEGARVYFHGKFKVDGDLVTGTEQWLIFANDKLMASKFWVADGGARECVVTWRVTGAKVPPKACGSCDTGLALHAAVDVSATTCPEGLWEKEQEREFDTTYDVRRQDDGAAIFYFHESGKQLGQGHHADGALSYITDPSCQWY